MYPIYDDDVDKLIAYTFGRLVMQGYVPQRRELEAVVEAVLEYLYDMGAIEYGPLMQEEGCGVMDCEVCKEAQEGQQASETHEME